MQQENNMGAPEVQAATSAPDNGVVFNDKPKKNKGMMLGMILLAILAAGGIGFGVWAMLDGNARAGKLNDQISSLQQQNSNLLERVSDELVESEDATIDATNSVDIDLAQNLVDPYLVSLKYGVNLLDSGLNDESKVSVAYANLRNGDIFDGKLFYGILNEKYKYLFGNENELGKSNYQVGYDTITYDSSFDGFNVERYGGGGTGTSIVNIVKSAIMDGHNLIVQVYHDKVGLCDVGESASNYCVSTDEISDLHSWVDKHQDSVPVFSMTFSQNDNHYVLTGVEKL